MYTISINTNKEKLDAILHFLKAFEVDFKVFEPELSIEQTTEFKKRLAYSIENPDEGFTWEEMEKDWEDEK